MRNKVLKFKVFFVFVLLTFVLKAQENSISPIFGLSPSETSFQNELTAINQTLGKDIVIDSFATESFIGKNFTVSTLESSNVDKLFILKNPDSLFVYDLPYFFEPYYSGLQPVQVLDLDLDDLDYHHASSLIYGYNVANQELHSIIPFSGDIQNSKSISLNTNAVNFSISTNEEYILLKGIDNDTTKIVFYNIVTDAIVEKNIVEHYTEFRIVGNHNLDNFYAIATDVDEINWLLEINTATYDVTVVSAISSCSDCSVEDFSYDKNAIALDWENNQMLTVLNESKLGQENYYLITLDLASGEIVHFTTLDKQISNLYFNKSASDLVFPGDANHDKVVNVRDLFSIGLRYSYNTIPRFTQGSEWVGQHAFNTGVIAQGVDVKHADCNGDGQINSLDVDVIKENYSSIHNSNKSTSASSADCDYPVGFTFVETAYEDNDVQINIKLGETFDSVFNVYALSFTLTYDNQFVVPNTMQIVGMDSWFGDDGVNCINTYYDDYVQGKMDVSITGIDLLNRSGGGDLLSATWTMEDDLMPVAELSAEMNLRIDDIVLINLAEEELETCSSDTNLIVFNKNMVDITTVENNKIDIYPNPSNSTVNVFTNQKIDKIELIDIKGKVIETYNIERSINFDVSDKSSGVYYLKVYSFGNFYYQKLIIE